MNNEHPFYIKSCSLLLFAEGEKAHSLAEFHDHLLKTSAASVYTHFWEKRLQILN